MFRAITKQLINITLIASSLSYWICLFASMICLFIAMAGNQKGKVGVTVSVIVYTVIQCILSVF